MKGAKTTLRATVEDLAEIDRRARDHGLNRTAYLTALGTGRALPVPAALGLTGRVEVLERQMAAVRRLLGLQDDDERGVL
jgi:hypothetical protein